VRDSVFARGLGAAADVARDGLDTARKVAGRVKRAVRSVLPF
jgi:hypothetical protein